MKAAELAGWFILIFYTIWLLVKQLLILLSKFSQDTPSEGFIILNQTRTDLFPQLNKFVVF